MSPYVHNIGRWADFLRSNPQWTAAVNAALDAVGLTESYIAAIECSTAEGRFKAIKDSVWGMVEFEAPDLALLDCPVVQRLRHIRQLGFSYLTYPGAQHSRFEHTVGVYHVACRILEAARRTRAVLDRSENSTNDSITAFSYETVHGGKDAVLIKHAAILHDIGHAAFSHASEDYFVDRQETVRIGPFTIREFLGDFRAYYLGQQQGTQRVVGHRESKKLTEILAVGIIVSERFSTFYSKLCHTAYVDAASDLWRIGALILGDRIYEDDGALPAILSGPFDADKIDYMLRDASACGISLGIDVSRLFFRAGIYEVRTRDALSLEAMDDVLMSSLPCKLFLLDQSGVDAIREMGMGRLSLYSRVYHHQLTRNAEAHFQELLDHIASSQHAEDDLARDFLKLWPLSDNGVQEFVRRRHAVALPAGEISESNLWERQLLKRAACFTADFILGNDPEWPEALAPFGEAIERARHATLQRIHEAIGDPAQNRRIVELLKDECSTIRTALLAAGRPARTLPSSERPAELRLVGLPKKKEPTLPEALVLRPGRKVGKVTPRFFSYYDSGRIQERRGYLFSPEPWRKIALLAFQRILFKEFLSEPSETTCLAPSFASELFVPEDSGGEALIYQHRMPIRVNFRPVLDIRGAAYESGLPWDEVKSLQHTVEHLYCTMPFLIQNYGATQLPNRDALALFDGEGGWRTSISRRDRPDDPLNAFLAQFPPNLRSSASEMVGRIKVLDRDFLGKSLASVVRDLAGSLKGRNIRLVPQSPSSGHVLRSFLKDLPSDYQLHASLPDALSVAGDNDAICFFDDNIASGTQASRQLKLWLGLETNLPPVSANYFLSPLSTQHRKLFCTLPVAFAFAVGGNSGLTRLEESAKSSGLAFAAGRFACDLHELSGKQGTSGEIRAELRDFLRRVGIGIAFGRLLDEGKDPSTCRAEAERKALGYDNLEGLMVTHFNVPTSTYSALWSPGTYCPEGDPFDTEKRIPWRPLFIRAGNLRSVVLF